jgi:hypothetical protein
MNIEKLLTMIQQIELLNSLKNDMSFGQVPDYMVQDRSVKQGVMSQDRLFNNQGIENQYGNSRMSNDTMIELPRFESPSQENIPVSFSDFFGDPRYNYENSIMLPKKDDIDG